MRYISDEKELRKISIYTNIESVKKSLEQFFYKKETEEDSESERINVAIIDSSEPFQQKEQIIQKLFLMLQEGIQTLNKEFIKV